LSVVSLRQRSGAGDQVISHVQFVHDYSDASSLGRYG
jgi:hypothetical protein